MTLTEGKVRISIRELLEIYQFVSSVESRYNEVTPSQNFFKDNLKGVK
jgi:hypothetical protein